MSISIHTFGDGRRDILGIHGWNGSSGAFEALAKSLGDEFTLHAVDLPGFGDSQAPEEWSLNVVTDLLARAMEDVGAPRLSVLGACSGLYFAVKLAERFPERISSVVGLEPFPRVPWYLRLFLIPGAGPLAYYTAFGNPVGRQIGEFFLDGEENSSTDMLESFSERSAEIPYRYLEMFSDIEMDDLPELPDISKKLIFAEESLAIVSKHRRHWQMIWPDVEIDVLDGTDHLLLQNAPGKVAGSISA